MHYTGSPYMIITYEAALGFKKVGDSSHIEIQIHIYLFVASNKVTIKYLLKQYVQQCLHRRQQKNHTVIKSTATLNLVNLCFKD